MHTYNIHTVWTYRCIVLYRREEAQFQGKNSPEVAGKVLVEAQQGESDEEFARRLQEQQDRRMAMQMNTVPVPQTNICRVTIPANCRSGQTFNAEAPDGRTH